MRLQNIYDSIPDAIDRVVEKVLAKYEWVDVANPYRVMEIECVAIYPKMLSVVEMQEIAIELNGAAPTSIKNNLIVTTGQSIMFPGLRDINHDNKIR